MTLAVINLQSSAHQEDAKKELKKCNTYILLNVVRPKLAVRRDKLELLINALRSVLSS